jgi:hypothetical protein
VVPVRIAAPALGLHALMLPACARRGRPGDPDLRPRRAGLSRQGWWVT